MRTRATDLRLAILVGLLWLLPVGGWAQGPAPSERPLVVIDAGHGGADPGARGASGLREKDVALAVARELAALLRERGVYEVRLTRTDDVLVPLRERPRLANRWRGGEARGGRPALFLSIHVNAHRDPAARGFESYFLSDARTEEARRVAEMENAALKFEQPDAARDGGALSFILSDLRQNRYVHESSAWAEQIQRRIARANPGPDRGVKQAAFVVLEGAFMPAVLVELGFISNRVEERMLADPAHRTRLAQELARAVGDYFDVRYTR